MPAETAERNIVKENSLAYQYNICHHNLTGSEGHPSSYSM
jgi:hypothetical protein